MITINIDEKQVEEMFLNLKSDLLNWSITTRSRT